MRVKHLAGYKAILILLAFLLVTTQFQYIRAEEVEEIEEVEKVEENEEEQVLSCIDSIQCIPRSIYDSGVYFEVHLNCSVKDISIHINGDGKYIIDTISIQNGNTLRLDGCFDVGNYYVESIQYSVDGEDRIEDYSWDTSLQFEVSCEESFEVNNETSSKARMTMQDLRKKFPHGKFWNHAGMKNNNQDGYTEIPCDPIKHVEADLTCNWFVYNGFAYSAQCMGFAEKCGYDATGYNPRFNANGWKTVTSKSALNTLKPGDIIRYLNNGHSIYVIGVDGDEVTFADCNYGHTCFIRWGAKTTKSEIMQTFTNVRVCPYEIPNANHETNFISKKDAYSAGETVILEWNSAIYADSFKLILSGGEEREVGDVEDCAQYCFDDLPAGEYKASLIAYKGNGEVLEENTVSFVILPKIETGVYDIYNETSPNKTLSSYLITCLEDGYYSILDTDTNKSIVEEETQWEAIYVKEKYFAFQAVNSNQYLNMILPSHELSLVQNMDQANQHFRLMKSREEVRPLTQTRLILRAGDVYNLSAIDSVSNQITWSSDWVRTATVSPTGLVTAVANGEANITARTPNGKKEICHVLVTDAPEIEGYSVSLTGNVALNYHINIPQSIAEEDTTKMEFKTPKGIISVSIQEAKKEGDLYVFSCPLSVKETQDQIEGQLIWNEGSLSLGTYSVQDYLSYLEKNETKYTRKTRNIVKSLRLYGKYAQSYFEYKDQDLELKDLDEIDLKEYAYACDGEIPFIGARFVLKSKPALKLYFNRNETYTVEWEDSFISQEGKYTVINIQNIDDFYHIFTIRSDSGELRYSIASFANQAMHVENPKLKNLMISMTLFANSCRE